MSSITARHGAVKPDQPQTPFSVHPDDESVAERLARVCPYTLLATNNFGSETPPQRWHKHVALANFAEILPAPPGCMTSIHIDVDIPTVYVVGPDGKRVPTYPSATAWMDAGIPPPNSVPVNPATGHAQYIYLLGDKNWVRTESANRKPLHLAQAIQQALTRAIPGGGDLRHNTAGWMHNPLHAKYRATTTYPRREPYSLDELRQSLDLDVPHRAAGEIKKDGRNNQAFNETRVWAYDEVTLYAGGSYEVWHLAVLRYILAIAPRIRSEYPEADHPYTDYEARASAKSIASFCWRRFRGGVVGAAQRILTSLMSSTQRKAKQRRAAGIPRREEWLALALAKERRPKVAEMRAQGISVRDIAKALGCSKSEVSRLGRGLDSLSTVVLQSLHPPCAPTHARETPIF